MLNINPIEIGASLYVPAINANIIKIGLREKIPDLRSLIIDTEDSILEDQIEFSMQNIQKFLNVLKEEKGKQSISNFNNQNTFKKFNFIRIRSEKYLKDKKNSFLKLKNIQEIDGFVIPKSNLINIEYVLKTLKEEGMDLSIMPVFEDTNITSSEMFEIKELLKQNKKYITSLRVGATDILSNFNLRRTCNTTIYEFPIVSSFIVKLVRIFKPENFNITGPVYECFSNQKEVSELLEKETKLDLMNGLFGKTIIHPIQLKIVEDNYRVSKEDLNIANELLNPYSNAVFNMYGKMNEKATHTNWAKKIVERSLIYGVITE